jgi:DNA-binding response OmpR family regulator
MTLNRVLIVEDSRDVGRYYQEAIRMAFPGVPISLVPSAEEALLESSRYSYDLLVADIRLPGISGFDLVRKIRPRLPEIKVLIITGLKVDLSIEKQARDLSVDLLLSKPVGVKDFLSSVERLSGEKSRLPLDEMDATLGIQSPPAARAETQPPQQPPAQVNTAAEKPPAAEQNSLRLLLSDLRSSLNALAVILLDEQGAVAEKAGVWPTPDLEKQLAPEVLALRSDLDRLSALLKPTGTSSAHAIHGDTFDLAFAPVDRSTVLVFLRASSGPLRLALAFEHLLTVQGKLARMLEERRARENIAAAPAVQVAIPAVEEAVPARSAQKATAPLPQVRLSLKPVEPAEPPLPEDPAALESLTELLGQKGEKPPAQDVDAFWDTAVTTKKTSTPGEGALTYEQARELGLLPKDEK